MRARLGAQWPTGWSTCGRVRERRALTLPAHPRRAVLPHDVLLEMRFVGVCHTDLHAAMGSLAALMGAN